MCGICGLIQVTGTPRPVVDAETLLRMTDAMTHRGPNDRGIHTADGVALGVRRLSIVDVEGGHQPLSNEDGSVWAIQNGELYNQRAIRSELAQDGHLFRTSCDTEVIPHLYERYGASFPTQLRGMFALAVWDEGQRRAVISRDRLGIKPLYHARVGDLLIFASELKSLLSTGLVDTELDLEAIDAYLNFGFFPAPRTPLAAVSKLLPGHSLIVGNGETKIEQYWEYPRWSPSPDRRSVKSYAEELLSLLDESVRLRLMSDVPLGAMLSGGIDSSVIVALMAHHMSEPVKTFSVGFSGSPESNELADAHFVAQRLGTEHYELELSITEDAVELEELVWYLDEPLADLSSLGFLALSELAAKHVTVALSGQGADELLAGYRKHRLAGFVGAARRLPPVVRRSAARAAAAHGSNRLRRVTRVAAMDDPVERLTEMTSQLSEDVRRALYHEPLAAVAGGGGREAVARRFRDAPDNPLPATLYLDAQLALPDDMLHYFDRASMAHSLEVRVPFLDHKLVEFCATIPPGLKLRRGTTTKYVLKQAARGLIPDRIIDKPKIGFFNATIDRWFQAQADRAIPKHLFASDARYARLLQTEEVHRLVERHRRTWNRRDGRLLLAILMLEVWLSTYLPRATARHSSVSAPVR